jgi:hypothetical protein
LNEELIGRQANFTALNIEPDDQTDDEVDNTKEIQVGGPVASVIW